MSDLLNPLVSRGMQSEMFHSTILNLLIVKDRSINFFFSNLFSLYFCHRVSLSTMEATTALYLVKISWFGYQSFSYWSFQKKIWYWMYLFVEMNLVKACRNRSFVFWKYFKDIFVVRTCSRTFLIDIFIRICLSFCQSLDIYHKYIIND